MKACGTVVFSSFMVLFLHVEVVEETAHVPKLDERRGELWRAGQIPHWIVSHI